MKMNGYFHSRDLNVVDIKNSIKIGNKDNIFNVFLL